jgi:hypothetical protein
MSLRHRLTDFKANFEAGGRTYRLRSLKQTIPRTRSWPGIAAAMAFFRKGACVLRTTMAAENYPG